MIEFILKNKEWIFSGIGITVFSFLFWFFRNRKDGGNKTIQKQKSGSHSVNIQTQGNLTIGENVSEKILDHGKKTDTEKW